MIPTALLLALPILAAEPANYPLAASLELPSAATMRLDLGAEWLTHCPEPDSYMLLDSEGVEVPFAARSSDEGADWRREALSWEPVRSARGWAWMVQPPATGEPSHALRLTKLPRGSVVEVTVQPVDGGEPLQRAVLWNLPDTGAGTRMELPLGLAGAEGPWLVRAVWSEGAGWMRVGRDLGFEAIVARPWTVETVELSVQPEGPVISGPTTSDWQLGLPRAGLPLRGLELEIADPLFSRQLTLLEPSAGGQLDPVARGGLERLNYGEAWVDATGLTLTRRAPITLLMRLDDGRSAPLDVRSATVTLRGQALVVPGVAGGSYTLLGCGPSAAGYDLERLDDRLVEQPAQRVEAPAPEAHAAWVPASVGEGLLAAGPALDRSGFRWERTVTGPAGLVRVALDDHILANTRRGQPDLRFVDAEGRQLPFLLQDEPMGRRQVGLVPERQEFGSQSQLAIALPHAGLPARSLVLRSERTRFHREVTVYDGPATGGMRLTGATWQGVEEGESRLILPLDRPLSRQLTVVVDNGDNPPRPIEAIELITRGASAWLALPASSGASVLYGHGELAHPSYDLQLLRERVLTQPVQPASLGVAQELAPLPTEPPRKGLLLAAVALLSALLLGLIVRLMRSPQEG